MPRLASLFAMPNPRRWDKATIPPTGVSWLPMAMLVVIIVIGPALAMTSPHLSLSLRADFAVSAVVMIWALRKARSCERAAVLALLRWILHASLLQDAFGPLPILPLDELPVVLLLFCEPALTAAMLALSKAARWHVEHSIKSKIFRWEVGALTTKLSPLSIFIVLAYAIFLVADMLMLIIAPNNVAHVYFLIGIVRSLIVLPALLMRSVKLYALAVYTLAVTSVIVAAISCINISDPLPVIATNITTIIYLVFSDHQRARILRQVRT